MSNDEDAIGDQFGALIRLHRTAQGASVEELANAAGMSLQELHAYENGVRTATIQQFVAFAKALDIPAPTLLTQLENRIEFGDAAGGVADQASLDFLSSNRGRQIIRAMALCRTPELLDAVAGLLISATMKDVANDTVPGRNRGSEVGAEGPGSA